MRAGQISVAEEAQGGEDEQQREGIGPSVRGSSRGGEGTREGEGGRVRRGRDPYSFRDLVNVCNILH